MQNSGMAAVVQMLFWLAAVTGGAFAIWKHFAESKERRLWEKAKLAKEMLDDLDSNAKALDATYMLGAWKGRRYSRNAASEANLFEVSQGQVREVLDPARDPLGLNEVYVRECFDNLLFHIEICASAADRGLIEWSEMEPMLATLLAGTERETLDSLVSCAKHLRYFKAAKKLPILLEAALREQE